MATWALPWRRRRSGSDPGRQRVLLARAPGRRCREPSPARRRAHACTPRLSGSPPASLHHQIKRPQLSPDRADRPAAALPTTAHLFRVFFFPCSSGLRGQRLVATWLVVAAVRVLAGSGGRRRPAHELGGRDGMGQGHRGYRSVGQPGGRSAPRTVKRTVRRRARGDGSGLEHMCGMCLNFPFVI